MVDTIIIEDELAGVDVASRVEAVVGIKVREGDAPEPTLQPHPNEPTLHPFYSLVGRRQKRAMLRALKAQKTKLRMAGRHAGYRKTA